MVTSVRSIRPVINSSRLILVVPSFVIVDDLDIPCFTFAPSETYPPLIIDADAVLTASVAVQVSRPSIKAASARTLWLTPLTA